MCIQSTIFDKAPQKRELLVGIVCSVPKTYSLILDRVGPKMSMNQTGLGIPLGWPTYSVAEALRAVRALIRHSNANEMFACHQL